MCTNTWNWQMGFCWEDPILSINRKCHVCHDNVCLFAVKRLESHKLDITLKRSEKQIRSHHWQTCSLMFCKLSQVIVQVKRLLRTGEMLISDEWFIYILILLVLWPPGQTNVFRVTPCTLAHRRCLLHSLCSKHTHTYTGRAGSRSHS